MHKRKVTPGQFSVAGRGTAPGLGGWGFLLFDKYFDKGSVWTAIPGGFLSTVKTSLPFSHTLATLGEKR
jgi:hypothetical protein